jgi:hypothetical protein
MLAAQFNLQTQKLSWGSVLSVNRFEVVDYEMIRAGNVKLDLLLTPNHRTVVSLRRENNSYDLKVIQAKDFKVSHRIPVSAEWEEEGGLRPVSKEWAELIGWYIAEGCQSRHAWAVEIYQSLSANPRKVLRIRNLLHAVGAEFTEASFERKYKNRSNILTAFQVRGFAATMFRQYAPDKTFHPDVLLWETDLLKALLNGLVDGDGHRISEGQFKFCQKNAHTAHFAQAIAVRLGYSTRIRNYSYAPTFHQIYISEGRRISFRSNTNGKKPITTERYTGVVWCPTLPYGTFVARRAGRSFITGNSFPIELVERCVLALTNEGDWVLDPFSGVGSALLAALRHHRRAIGCEKEDEYVQIARKRVADLYSGALRYRPLGRPVYQPTGREKVSQVPREWLEQD